MTQMGLVVSDGEAEDNGALESDHEGSETPPLIDPPPLIGSKSRTDQPSRIQSCSTLQAIIINQHFYQSH